MFDDVYAMHTHGTVWECAGECGVKGLGSTPPPGWVIVSVQQVHQYAQLRTLKRESVNALEGAYCSYNCVAARAHLISRRRTLGISVPGTTTALIDTLETDNE